MDLERAKLHGKFPGTPALDDQQAVKLAKESYSKGKQFTFNTMQIAAVGDKGFHGGAKCLRCMHMRGEDYVGQQHALHECPLAKESSGGASSSNANLNF